MSDKVRIYKCSGVCESKDEHVSLEDYNRLARRIRVIKKSLDALEAEAETQELPFIHRSNPLYQGIIRLAKNPQGGEG